MFVSHISWSSGLSQMIALRYGTIPVVRETGGLKDSIQDSGDGEGNGFTFQSYNGEDMLASVHRALEGYAKPEGWKILEMCIRDRDRPVYRVEL